MGGCELRFEAIVNMQKIQGPVGGGVVQVGCEPRIEVIVKMQKEGRGIRSGVWVGGWGLGWVGMGVGSFVM